MRRMRSKTDIQLTGTPPLIYVGNTMTLLRVAQETVTNIQGGHKVTRGFLGPLAEYLLCEM